MKRHLSPCGGAAASLLLLFAACLRAGEADAMSYRAGGDFALTADPAAPLWKEVRGVSFEHGRRGEPIPGYMTEVRSRWTDRDLYILFVCPYENLYLKPGPPADGETNGLWDWDVAEVFIGSDFDNIGNYKEFEVSPRGEWVDLSIDRAPGSSAKVDWRWNSGFDQKTRIDERNRIWYVEMRIPFASLAPWKPAAGRAFRVNFYRIQGSPRKFLAWQPVGQDSFHRPEAFGRLLLVDVPAR